MTVLRPSLPPPSRTVTRMPSFAPTGAAAAAVSASQLGRRAAAAPPSTPAWRKRRRLMLRGSEPAGTERASSTSAVSRSKVIVVLGELRVGGQEREQEQVRPL